MDRLVKRKDFLAAAASLRANAGPLLMQARARADAAPPRIGLTVTRKHGNAVERNRIRRRLRAAVREVLPQAARPGFDYVIVAKRATIATRFADLLREIERGLARLHTPRAATGSRRRPGSPQPGVSQASPPRADGDAAND
ncbi:MAG TPA: ribonuclease P protein component [Xanthobacteraceae bacterium]|nr:ribonuclease P protein component [Xanthobacteraceae bacterium]